MLAWHSSLVADFGGRLPGPGCLVQGMHAFQGSRRRTERAAAAAGLQLKPRAAQGIDIHGRDVIFLAAGPRPHDDKDLLVLYNYY